MISNITYVEAIRLAQQQVLASNDKTFILGLGSSDPKGMFGTNLGLVEEFGNQRVMDAPLSENTLTGVSIGMAAMGYKPILVHHRLDFTLTAFEQMVNQAAKWFFNSGGKSNLPFLIRIAPGVSSVPAMKFPNITVEAPPANALNIFPIFPQFPPSLIIGIPRFFAILTQSKTADN
jgi:pyruvate/2-oxoglutarate/acetoin dehydrogenase E1 component